MRATWKPHEKHGRLTKRSDLPDSVFAFPKERKEPLTDARHVRNAIARFDQTEGIEARERDLAFANIKKAAKHYDVDMSEADWHELGTKPHSKARKSSAKRKSGAKSTTRKKKTARKTASTRKKTTTRKSSSTRKKTTTRKTSTRKKTR